MPFKDRFRRAVRSDRPGSGSSSSNSNSDSRVQTAFNTPGTSGAATPNTSHRNSNANPPSITLTKSNTMNRLSLSKTLTWSKKSKEEKMAEKQQKRLDYWEQKDKLEWTTPEDGWRRSGKKRSKQHQDMLRAFEFDFSARRKSMSSWISGISPGQSRVGSVDDNADGAGKNRKRSSTVGVGSSSLSRQVTREEPEDQDGPLGHTIATVSEV